MLIGNATRLAYIMRFRVMREGSKTSTTHQTACRPTCCGLRTDTTVSSSRRKMADVGLSVCVVVDSRKPWQVACLALCLAFIGSVANALPPSLYGEPGYQSPVAAGAGDFLLLAGSGLKASDTIVYQEVTAAMDRGSRPAGLPSESTATLGRAAIVNADDVPYALTLRFPDALDAARVYALRVYTALGEWSDPVFINDPRPLWFSPAAVYSSATVGSLPRYLKVIGRNLDAASAAATEVQLVGPERYSLKASRDAEGSLSRYVARVMLPLRLHPGRYQVQLRRYGGKWVEVAGQSLEVRTDPAPARRFPVGEPGFGGCRPNDDRDDTTCLRRAIAAAAKVSGTVVLGAGVWKIGRDKTLDVDGVVLAAGVGLEGAGRDVTVLERAASGRPESGAAAITLAGRNQVRGITFSDAREYRAGDHFEPMLQLGVRRSEDGGRSDAVTAAVEDIVIADNRFKGAHPAVSDGGLPIRRPVIVGNEFGAYSIGLELIGNRYNLRHKFRIDDAVIVNNSFKPGSYLDVPLGQGAMASELGAGIRVDFSDNTADGAAVEYLYHHHDAAGWRAAFFWNLTNNQELVLVSGNLATCTGDKDGDGEALALDNNGNVFALDAMRSVRDATADRVSIDGPMASRQFDRQIDSSSFYVDDWIQVLRGPGVGQARRIVSYGVDAAGHVSLRVTPRWDVVPVAGETGVSIGRQFWQFYALNNRVDNRQPLCQKSNRTAPKAGGIVLWAQMSDVVVAGNEQHDSDGVVLQTLYSAAEPGCADCAQGVFFNSAVAISDNTIDGEYRFDDGCSSSGIFISLGASPHAAPATASFGLVIDHNVIRRADARGGGAITMQPTWHVGPEPHAWPLLRDLTVVHNDISGLGTKRARPCGREPGSPRAAITLPRLNLQRAVTIFGNSPADSAVLIP